MSWAKLSDTLHRHRKTRKAKLEAMGLWAVVLSFVAEHPATKRDGVTLDEVEGVASWAGATPAKARALVDRLVEAGFWRRDGDRFHFHDLTDYNPSAEEDEKRRQDATERQRRRRGRVTAGLVTPPVTRDKQRDSDDSSRVTSRTRADAPGACAGSRPDPDPRSPQPPEGADGGRLSELRRAYADGVCAATATPYVPPRSADENLVLEQLAETLGAGMPWPEFLAALTKHVSAYVRDCQARKQPPKFERGYAPSKFAEWVNAGDDDDEPAYDGPQSRWGDPTDAEIARGFS